MATATANRIIKKLADRFAANVAAKAAAINEVFTCQKFDEYLGGILAESDSPADVETAVFEWAERRGQIWA